MPVGRRQAALAISGACIMWGGYLHASVRYETRRIKELKSVIDVLDTSRLLRAMSVLNEYVHSGVTPYLPVLYSTDDHADSCSLGLVVEALGQGDLMIIDGVHRAVAALKSGIEEIDLAVIYPSFMTPPARGLIELTQIVNTTDGERTRPIFDGAENPYFRPGVDIVSSAENRLLNALP